jgi:hypothetical protein
MFRFVFLGQGSRFGVPRFSPTVRGVLVVVTPHFTLMSTPKPVKPRTELEHEPSTEKPEV